MAFLIQAPAKEGTGPWVTLTREKQTHLQPGSVMRPYARLAFKLAVWVQISQEGVQLLMGAQ